jgi:uncharacterized membrane protein YvbJ
MDDQKKCPACGAGMVEDGRYCSYCGKPDGSTQYSLNNQMVSVIDIKMPFLSMVTFMVKWAVAAIPAFIILFILGFFVVGMIEAIFGIALPRGPKLPF